MQAEIQTKVKISVSEIKKILAEKFCLYRDFELELVADSVVESKTVEQDNEGWIDVPEDWNERYCPTDCCAGELIDVRFRCGKEHHAVSPLDYMESWVQEFNKWDIVKYRVSK